MGDKRDEGHVITTKDSHKTEKIVCVTTSHPHRHIVSVGISGQAAAPARTMTVGEVRNALAAGDVFYTVGPTSGKVAIVHNDICKEYGCTIQTIRSAADAVTDNNLDNLDDCPRRAGG